MGKRQLLRVLNITEEKLLLGLGPMPSPPFHCRRFTVRCRLPPKRAFVYTYRSVDNPQTAATFQSFIPSWMITSWKLYHRVPVSINLSLCTLASVKIIWVWGRRQRHNRYGLLTFFLLCTREYKSSISVIIDMATISSLPWRGASLKRDRLR